MSLLATQSTPASPAGAPAVPPQTLTAGAHLYITPAPPCPGPYDATNPASVAWAQWCDGSNPVHVRNKLVGHILRLTDSAAIYAHRLDEAERGGFSSQSRLTTLRTIIAEHVRDIEGWEAMLEQHDAEQAPKLLAAAE